MGLGADFIFLPTKHSHSSINDERHYIRWIHSISLMRELLIDDFPGSNRLLADFTAFELHEPSQLTHFTHNVRSAFRLGIVKNPVSLLRPQTLGLTVFVLLTIAHVRPTIWNY
jgi:hypothetical protein